MHIYGLTGGIASGKSAVASVLKEFNCPIIDADVIAREGASDCCLGAWLNAIPHSCPAGQTSMETSGKALWQRYSAAR